MFLAKIIGVGSDVVNLWRMVELFDNHAILSLGAILQNLVVLGVMCIDVGQCRK